MEREREIKREGEREKESEMEREREIKREGEREMQNMVIELTGALAPFSYLVKHIFVPLD